MARRKIADSFHTCALCGKHAQTGINLTDYWLCRKHYNTFFDARDKANMNESDCGAKQAEAWAHWYIQKQLSQHS